jgi:hypothetical protein
MEITKSTSYGKMQISCGSRNAVFGLIEAEYGLGSKITFNFYPENIWALKSIHGIELDMRMHESRLDQGIYIYYTKGNGEDDYSKKLEDAITNIVNPTENEKLTLRYKELVYSPEAK